MSRWDYWDYYEKKPAREVKGGIKAQSKRGAFGESWWAKRWIAVLESFDIGARLSRGRSYARKGQVMNVDIGKGSVKAKVQGSSSRPYRITIEIKALTERDWRNLAQALSGEAIFAAKLLAGEMPQEIEQVFTRSGLSLFPAKLRDMETNCSCPDWSNPCKHIAAVYYLLGEEFDRDPFLLFRLRGMSREELIELLDAAGVGDIHETHAHQAHPATSELPREPLAADGNAFWRGGDLPADLFGEVNAPPVNAALPKRLGGFPFWRGTERFLEALEPVYTQASARGLDVFLDSVPGDRTG
ncbi:MAG TPA: SWIM zinc finger family protein [Pyrinomonadaceae bacterium]